MSLSPPAARTHIHTRQVICQGYRRDDGLWDIEGMVLDTKTYDCRPRAGYDAIPAGHPVHRMRIRVTIDDTLVIRQAEAITEDAPFPPCGEIAPSFASLVGLSLGDGFQRELRRRFGGTNGCTHLVELMGPIATTAFQTLYPILSHEQGESERPKVIDSCHALAADGPVVARAWPQFARPDHRT